MPLHPQTPSSLASFKSRLVSPFWYWFTPVVVEKRPLNRCRIYYIVFIAFSALAVLVRRHKEHSNDGMLSWLTCRPSYWWAAEGVMLSTCPSVCACLRACVFTAFSDRLAVDFQLSLLMSWDFWKYGSATLRLMLYIFVELSCISAMYVVWKEYMEKLMNEENEWDHKISAELNKDVQHQTQCCRSVFSEISRH